jgi:hypothetical protein
MNHRIGLRILFVSIMMLFSLIAVAQPCGPPPLTPCPPPPANPVPIHGIEFLLGAGAILGVKRYIDVRKQKEKEQP